MLLFLNRVHYHFPRATSNGQHFFWSFFERKGPPINAEARRTRRKRGGNAEMNRRERRENQLRLKDLIFVIWFFAVFSGILSPNRRKPVACGAHPRSNPFLEGHGTQVWKPASRSSAGQQQAGKPARRRLAGLIPKLRVPGHAGSTREGARGRG